jgi:hypothetical protein
MENLKIPPCHYDDDDEDFLRFEPFCECGAMDCWDEEEMASNVCKSCGGIIE